MLRFDSDFGLMYARSARFLPSDTHYAVFLRSDTDFGLMYGRCSRLWLSGHVLLGFCFRTDMSLQCFVLTHIVGVICTCSAGILLSDTQFTIMFCPNTGFGLTYTCSARILFSETFRLTASF